MPDVHELTEETVAKLRAGLVEEGYIGPLRKTKVGFQTFVYRAVSYKEYLDIVDDLGRNPAATQQDLTDRMVLAGVVYPELTKEGLADLGMGVSYSLRDKIEMVSGTLADPLAHFLGDEDVSTYETWVDPTEDELENIKKLYGDDPFVQIRSTRLMGFSFLYRNLKGREYAEVAPTQEGEDVRERVLAKGILWPANTDWSMLPAFIPEALQQKIFALSGVQLEPDIEDDEEL